MNSSGNAHEDKVSDKVIKEAIDTTIDFLKLNPAKFKAIYSDGSVVLFDKYEDAMEAYSKDGKCKMFVI
jgi:hypothetical protein